MEKILCSVSTRGRYETTLPSVLFSIINQTKKPNHLIIFDDNDPDKRDYLVSNQKIESAGFVPKKSLEDGIRELSQGLAIFNHKYFSNI